MPVPSYQIPIVGQSNATEDFKVAAALQTLLTLLTGGLDQTNMSINPILSVLGGVRKVAWGSIQVTGPGTASVYSNTMTVTHGLPGVPTLILPSPQNADVFVNPIGSPTSSTFQLLGHCVTGPWGSGSVTTSWLAAI